MTIRTLNLVRRLSIPLVTVGIVALLDFSWRAWTARRGETRQVPDFARARPVSEPPRSPRKPFPRLEASRETVQGSPIPPEKRRLLVRRATVSDGALPSARLASDKNQVMDELMNQATIPVDYGKGMVALFRDRTQDVHTRNFAVQHIGLYAEALNRRGAYDAASAEAGELRRALEEASRETACTVAAAAIRALADLAAFDNRIEGRGLERRLVACVGDAAAAPAVRVMAIQVCGERKVGAAISELRGVLQDPDSTMALRLAAAYALRCMGLNPTL